MKGGEGIEGRKGQEGERGTKGLGFREKGKIRKQKGGLLATR